MFQHLQAGLKTKGAWEREEEVSTSDVWVQRKRRRGT